MREQKYKYYSKYSDGGIATDICTLQEIEDGVIKKPYLSGIVARAEFTGLKDKNGKEIYEGDILKRSNGYKHMDYYVEVKYDAPSFQGIQRHEEGGTRWGYEVAGNIYENPELLEDL